MNYQIAAAVKAQSGDSFLGVESPVKAPRLPPVTAPGASVDLGDRYSLAL